MKPNALWGGAFALLAAAIAIAMVLILVQHRDVFPTEAPQTTVDYQDAFRPALRPLAALFAFDQMFVVAYGAAFVGAALTWRRPRALSWLVLLGGIATAGIDTAENVHTSVVLAGLADSGPTVKDLDLLDLLGALKWVGGGVTSLALAAIIPKRGVFFGLVALVLLVGGVGELALAAVRLDLVSVLAATEAKLAFGVVAAMPLGLALTGIALLSDARQAPKRG